jgi:hypothetical protein
MERVRMIRVVGFQSVLTFWQKELLDNEYGEGKIEYMQQVPARPKISPKR